MSNWPAILVASIAIFAQGQGDVRPAPSKKDPVTVRGCLHGTSLKLTDPIPLDVWSGTIRLKLSKALAKALGEHDGHEEELTGVMHDTPRAMGGTKSTPVGKKTKITYGAREERNTSQEVPELEVSSFRHVNPSCGG
jgi:hypothetical protein